MYCDQLDHNIIKKKFDEIQQDVLRERKIVKQDKYLSGELDIVFVAGDYNRNVLE